MRRPDARGAHARARPSRPLRPAGLAGYVDYNMQTLYSGLTGVAADMRTSEGCLVPGFWRAPLTVPAPVPLLPLAHPPSASPPSHTASRRNLPARPRSGPPAQ